MEEGERKEEEEEKERGAPPPLLVQFIPEGEGRAAYPRPALSLSTKAHKAHYFSRGDSDNPSGTPVLSETTRNTSGVRI